MSDRAYAAAVLRKQQISEEIVEIKERLALIERERTELEAFIQTWHKLVGDEFSLQPTPPVDPTAGQNPRKEDVAKVAEERIRLEDRPVPRRELLQHLDYAGMHIHGADPEKVLSTMMWRMRDKFVLLKGLGYWLADRPYGPARYIPPSVSDEDLRTANVI